MALGIKRKQQHMTVPQLRRVHAALAARLLDIPEPKNTEAIFQVLRVRSHPQFFTAVENMNNAMVELGPSGVRHCIEHIGNEKLIQLFPEAIDLITSYREGSSESELQSNAVRELVLIASFFYQEIFDIFFAVTTAEKTNRTIQNRFQMLSTIQEEGSHKSQAIDSELFWREYDELQSEAILLKQDTQLEPRASVEVRPVHVTVREQDQLLDYFLPARVYAYDPIHRFHDVEIGKPQLVDRFEVEKDLTIPLERIQNGLFIQIALPGRYNAYHTYTYHLSIGNVLQIAKKGSAVPTRMGRFDAIRTYPEHFSDHFLTSYDGHANYFPENSIVSLRVTNVAIEVRKIHSDARLTVFV